MKALISGHNSIPDYNGMGEIFLVCFDFLIIKVTQVYICST